MKSKKLTDGRWSTWGWFEGARIDAEASTKKESERRYLVKIAARRTDPRVRARGTRTVGEIVERHLVSMENQQTATRLRWAWRAHGHEVADLKVEGFDVVEAKRFRDILDEDQRQSNCESFILCNSGTDCNCGLGLEAMGRDYTNFMNDEFVCSTTTCADGSYPQCDGILCMCNAPSGGGGPAGGTPGVGGGYTPLTPAFMKMIDTGFGNGSTMRNSICNDSLAGMDVVEVVDAVRNDGDSIAGAAAALEADFLATGTCSP